MRPRPSLSRRLALRLTAHLLRLRRQVALGLGGLFLLSVVLVLTQRKGPEDLFAQALESLGMGNDAAAMESLRQIQREYPNWSGMAEVSVQEGNIRYFRYADIMGAIRCWEDALARGPSPDQAFAIQTRLADVCQNDIGDVRRAMDLWRKLIEEYPDRQEVDRFRLSIANAYVRFNQADLALVELRTLMATGRSLHLQQQAAIRLAMIHNAQKNYHQAQSLLEEVIAEPHCDTCRDMALPLLADALEAQNQFQRAIAIVGALPDNVMLEADRHARIEAIERKRRGAAQTPPRS